MVLYHLCLVQDNAVPMNIEEQPIIAIRPFLLASPATTACKSAGITGSPSLLAAHMLTIGSFYSKAFVRSRRCSCTQDTLAHQVGGSKHLRKQQFYVRKTWNGNWPSNMANMAK
jgi:hypothetical protein